jgi:hypothetical protein
MKGKYDKIANFNLSYENLLEAVTEFQGFVTGLSENDIFLARDFSWKSVMEIINKKELLPTADDPDLNYFIKNIASKIFDRTTGTYFMYDMMSGLTHSDGLNRQIKSAAFFDNRYDNPDGMGKYIHCVYPAQPGNVLFFENEKENTFVGTSPTNVHMGDVISYRQVTSLLKTGKTNSEGDIITDISGSEEQRYTVSNNVFGDPGVVYINENKIGNRYSKPSLGAITVRNPSVSIAGRNKSHLPIFFNGIPPIEMSRCTPYINIEVLKKDYSVKSEKISSMSQIGYMRFGQTKKGEFELEEFDGFTDVSPVGSEKIKKELDFKNDATTTYSFMDIFTSPQTLSNADINNSGKTAISLNYNNEDPVLDPIAPMLSLESLNVSITGAGFGLLASKKASMSMTLHDRSRMRDLSPLLTNFSTTKMIIEFGWNHPEGGVTSDSTIGKYLSALKERSLYQVVGTNFSFGGGNTVKIDIDLAAYGFRNTEKVHCGAGPEVPLVILEDAINKLASDMVKTSKDADEAPEVRQKIKINSRNARSINSAMSWTSYEQIAKFLKVGGNKKEIVNTLKSVLSPGKFENDSQLSKDIEDKEKETEDMISRMIGKLEGIRESAKFFTGENLSTEVAASSKDPFLLSTVYRGHNEYYSLPRKESGYVSVGKLISSFIGHSIAATCLYDEVQLVFYPLNHHAAGGRIHTTASIPIPVSVIEKAIDDKLNKTDNISINLFFKMIEKIVRDRNLDVYGLSGIYDEVKSARDKDKEVQFQTVKNYLKENDAAGLGLDLITVLFIKNCSSYEQIYNDKQLDLIVETEESIGELKRKLNTINGEIKNIDYVLKNSKNLSTNSIIKQLSLGSEYSGSNKLSVLAKATAIRGELTAEIGLIKTDIIKNEDILKKESRRIKAYEKAVKAVTEALSESASDNLTKRCKDIYNKDGLKNIYPAEAKFVRPNLAMDFEVIEAIDAAKTESNFFDSYNFNKQKDLKQTNGLKDDTTILRIHIYDEEAIIDPASYAVHNAMISGAESSEINNVDYLNKIKNAVGDLNYNSVKQIMKRAYPTIIYGANGSTIKTLSVSANTSGELSNVLIVESYGNIKDGQVSGKSYENEFESIMTLPNTVSLSMLGQPMIGRGNNIFIDFGTNTSLDNIYTVKTVTHDLSKGNFNTNVSLVPANIGAISSFRERMTDAIDVLLP